MAEGSCSSMQFIKKLDREKDGEFKFNAKDLRSFINTVKLHQCGLEYAVVAVMGPQSSGKSTLLNHLFCTNFTEMDAVKDRGQTTTGAWIAKAVGIEPFTIVMDLEGTDSQENGEDNTTFEKKSALFVLAVADIVLINMWCHDIGREHASNRPLLKTVFQVMVRLFSPRKTTLLFVIRDRTKTPNEILEGKLRGDIKKIWETVPKPEEHNNTPLSKFFNVEFEFLSNYEDKEETFKEEVKNLRQRFHHCISPGGLAGDRRDVVPGSGFFCNAEKIWETINKNKDLNLPAHRVMVAEVRCKEIAEEKYNDLASDQEWLDLEQSAQSGDTSCFGKCISSVLKRYLSDYDEESEHYEENVRNEKYQYLESKALQLVRPTYNKMLTNIRKNTLERFRIQLQKCLGEGKGFASSVRTCEESSMDEFDQGCSDAAIQQAKAKANWNDASKVKEELRGDIKYHASRVSEEKVKELVDQNKKGLLVRLSEPVKLLLEAGETNTWASIRKLVNSESEPAESEFSSAIAGFELEQAKVEEIYNLKEYLRELVKEILREREGNILSYMKERFLYVFNHNKDSTPRVWKGNDEDIGAILKEARRECMKLLATVTAVRLDEQTDNIENVLLSALLQSTDNTGVGGLGNPLASNTWEEVPPDNTLISPVQCKALWNQFLAETEYAIFEAFDQQRAGSPDWDELSSNIKTAMKWTLVGCRAVSTVLVCSGILLGEPQAAAALLPLLALLKS